MPHVQKEIMINATFKAPHPNTLLTDPAHTPLHPQFMQLSIIILKLFLQSSSKSNHHWNFAQNQYTFVNDSKQKITSYKITRFCLMFFQKSMPKSMINIWFMIQINVKNMPKSIYFDSWKSIIILIYSSITTFLLRN